MGVPGSLSLRGHFVGVKVSAGLAAALVPAHVLAQVLLSDHPAVNRPLVPRALVRQCSCQEWQKDRTLHFIDSIIRHHPWQHAYITPDTQAHLEDATFATASNVQYYCYTIKNTFSLLIIGVCFTRKCYVLIICVIF